MDLSRLDKKYFIDPHIYNCPFCKRNNVSYSMINNFAFHWGETKICRGYIIKCGSEGCGKTSMHLSFQELRKFYVDYAKRREYSNKFADGVDIDAALFFSQPTSYFVLDSRIPEKVRKLIYEAENSHKSNYLVGASACLRKAIYELLGHEKSIVRNPKTGYADYQASIKSLKEKFTNVASELFDALGHTQEMVSDNVHEGSWEAWDSPKLRFIIELTKATLHEMYVVPEERKERLGLLGQMKAAFSNSKSTSSKDEELEKQ